MCFVLLVLVFLNNLVYELNVYLHNSSSFATLASLKVFLYDCETTELLLVQVDRGVQCRELKMGVVRAQYQMTQLN